MGNGTGFAMYSTTADANMAIKKLDGADFHGHTVQVDAYKKTGNKYVPRNGAGASFRTESGCGSNKVGRVLKPLFDKRESAKGCGKSSNKIRDPEKTVWLGNLPEDVSFKYVQEFMSQAGECKYVALLKHGTGFAVMGSPEEALAAIDMLNGTTLGDNTIIVDTWETAKR